MGNRNELFNAIPIFDSRLTDHEIREFSIRNKQGQGLVNYLHGYAESDEDKRL